MAKKLIKWAKETGVSTLAIPAKVGQCRPCQYMYCVCTTDYKYLTFLTVYRYAQIGEGCAKPGFPGVYARVTEVMDWIKENTDGTQSSDCSA